VDGNVGTGCAVYVYHSPPAAGVVIPDDLYEGSPVVTAARVRYDVSSGGYRFAAGALLDDDVGAEPYAIAMTCDADNPLDDETAVVDADGPVDKEDETIVFGAPQNVGVNAGQTVTVEL
jgi:hypothetical protein